MSFSSLKNHLLIAMPNLHDGMFDRSVIVICEHSPEGAMGLVINRLLDISLAKALEAVNITPPEDAAQKPVFWGGPVQPQHGFILHEGAGDWQVSMAVGEGLFLTSSPDILMAIAEHRGPERFLLALGYAGWSEGQLEQELSENSWLHGPIDLSVLFELPPAERWQAAARGLGVDMRLLSGAAGHA
jgi:putative transcriptional regulator